MTGGNDNKVQSVKGYNADGFHIEDLPPLPTNKIGHCVVALDGYELFVTGKAIWVKNEIFFTIHWWLAFLVSGGYNSVKTYILTATDNDAARGGNFYWSSVKTLPTSSGGLMCSKVDTKDPGYATHTQKVVVAGGRHDQTNLKLVYIYDVKENKWSQGNYRVSAPGTRLHGCCRLGAGRSDKQQKW